jgi:hypothetical protein
MRRSSIGWFIGLAFILAIPSVLFVREYKRASDLSCGAARVENTEDAKNAVRNYHGQVLTPDMLSKLSQNELFQSGGRGEKGGWWVEKWTTFMGIHGYTVSF